MFGEVTDRERLGWQPRAARVLVELLDRAAKEGLPVKDWTWTVSTARLTGQSYILDPVQRRADWEAWRAALGAEAWPEHRSGIRTHLHAVAKDVDGLLDVAVIADLIEDEEESQEGS